MSAVNYINQANHRDLIWTAPPPPTCLTILDMKEAYVIGRGSHSCVFDVVCEGVSAGSGGKMWGNVSVLCFSYRAYERIEAVTVGDGANTSICNLYWYLLHRAAVPTQLKSVWWSPHWNQIHHLIILKHRNVPVVYSQADIILFSMGLLDTDPFKAV